MGWMAMAMGRAVVTLAHVQSPGICTSVKVSRPGVKHLNCVLRSRSQWEMTSAATLGRWKRIIFLSLGYGFIGNKDRNTQEHFLSWGCLTQHISVCVGFWCACSSAESAEVMTSRAWNPQGDPSQQDLQMFALGVFPKYPGF